MVSVTAVWLRRAVQILLLAVLFIAVMTAREIHRGEGALRASDAAFHRGELQAAVLHARTAALSYVPGAPHVSSAYERLEAVARGAEAEGRYELARSAWGAVRSSVLQTSHWLVSRSDELDRAHEALARLNRAAALRAEAGALARRAPTGVEPSPEPGAAQEWGEPHAAAHGKKLVRLGLLALGLASLALGLGVAGFRVLDAAGRASRGGLLLATALCLGGAGCWLFVVVTG